MPSIGETMTETDHAPYVRAVVGAIERAGLDVDEWYADPNDPRDAAITLDRSATRAAYGERPVVLGWTEERGWYWGVERLGDGELHQLFDSPMPDVVADPARVAEWAQTVADGTTARWPVTGRRRDDDEDGFVDALRSYWPREDLPA
jgi:hypothetical protein